MKKQYAVWTYYNNTIGVRLFIGTKLECMRYFNKAIIKGARIGSMKIEKVTKYG